MIPNRRLAWSALAVAGLLGAASAQATEMAMQFYQCPAAGGSCGEYGIEGATVCVDVLEATLHPDVDFKTVVGLEEKRTRTKAHGWARIRDSVPSGNGYQFFEGTIRYIMIPPRGTDACRAACDVQYQWSHQETGYPRPVADLNACHIDVVERDDYRCTDPREEPVSFTTGGAPDGNYRKDESGETVMVEDGHQTRLFGMALECPESRLREKARPARIERVRPGAMREQMRPGLPAPGDIDPQRTLERRTVPTR